jgi:branched-chain amino acid transport system substrate-binding protein
MRPEFSGEGKQNQRVLRRSARSNQNNIREKIMRVSLFGALATGITASLVGLSAIAADTIRIGLISEITGPNAEAGSYTINGAKLAAEEINKKGGILGKQVELVIEDNQSTNPGTVLAFSKLGGSKEIPAIIGPIRSTQIQAASPSIQKAGIPTMIGGTDPSLTHVNNPWVFRCRPNDTYSSRVIADFGVNKLKLRKWAIVHSTDAFGSGGQKALTDALKGFGVEPVLVQGYTNNSQDFTPVVLAIKKSGADVIGSYMTNSQDLGIFAKQLRQLGVAATWVGSPSIVTDTAMKLAGESLHGTYGIADFNPDANGEAKAFAVIYRGKYNLEPDVYSSWAFDALNVIAASINTAKSTKPEDIRKAIMGLKNWKGVEGAYNFDENGDGLRGYNVVKNEGGRIKFVEHIDFDK